LAPHYVETWKYLLETGVYYGPTKVTFLFTYIPGPDRRSGIWIDRQSWENIAGGLFLGSAPVYLPYSLLMSYQYGGGLNALNCRGEGYMTDAITYGLRIDHAVAANLNVSGSFFMAQRQSKGWGWGSLTMVGPNAGRGVPRVALLGGFMQPAAQFLNGNGTPWGVGAVVAPSIPDDNLGWEVTAGVNWKILEGLTINLRAAYWHVGEWFKFACVDKQFVSAGNLVPLPPALGGGSYIDPRNNDGPWGWGVNPSRNIDPIVMFQGVMTVDF